MMKKFTWKEASDGVYSLHTRGYIASVEIAGADRFGNTIMGACVSEAKAAVVRAIRREMENAQAKA